MRRSIIALLTVFLVLFSLPLGSVVLAQDNDEEALENELALKIPEETDNPNYNLTFIDPSDTGVFISIDGGKEREISTPYALPSLGIGKHTLSFKYTTEEEQESTYVDEIIVVPRPPQINPPDHTNNKLIVNGTALAGSKVYLFLTGGGESYREMVTLEETTDWEYIFENEFVDSVYTITAYVTKNGYGSALSEPVTFSIGTTGGDVEQEEEDELGTLNFQLAHIINKDVLNTYMNNTDLILYTVALLLIGIILGILAHRFLFVRGEKKLEHNFKKMLSGDKEKKDDKGKKDKGKGTDEGETKQDAPSDEQSDTGPDGPNANLYEEEFPPFQKDADLEEEVEGEESTDEGDGTEEVTEEEQDIEAPVGEQSEEEETAEDDVVEEDSDKEEEGAEEEVVEEETEAEEEILEEDADSDEEVVEEDTGTGEEGGDESTEEVPTEEGEGTTEEMADEEGEETPQEDGEESTEETSESKYGKGASGASTTPKEERKSVFSFLRRNKDEDKEEKVEENPQKEKGQADEEVEVESQESADEETDSEETEEKEAEELSREEFLEKFKQHDPDPEEEEKTGSMSEKVVEDTKSKSESEGDEEDTEEDTEGEAEDGSEVNDDKIENAGLSTRTTNALLEAGYKNVEELEELDKSELVDISGIGLVAADEITAILRDEKKPTKSKKQNEEKTKPPKKKKPKKPRKKPSRRRNIKISLTSND